jgi:hypothetical protein
MIHEKFIRAPAGTCGRPPALQGLEPDLLIIDNSTSAAARWAILGVAPEKLGESADLDGVPWRTPLRPTRIRTSPIPESQFGTDNADPNPCMRGYILGWFRISWLGVLVRCIENGIRTGLACMISCI